MSWLNSSFNTIKGQLSNLAQEVLAETAGPGDDEYRGELSDIINTKSAVELLAETQKQNEDLDKLCKEKDREIASLRKKITIIQDQIVSDSGGEAGSESITGNKRNKQSTSSKLSTDEQNQPQNEQLEDSWYWEPDNPTSTTGDGNGNEMVNVALVAETDVTSGARMDNNNKQTANLQSRIQQLEAENRQLNNALEELDSQHSVAMQDVLGLKAELQAKLATVTEAYETLKQEQAERFISNELAMAKIQKECEQLQRARVSANEEKQAVQFRLDDYAAQLKKATEDCAELNELLSKKTADNTELIERIKEMDSAISLGQSEREELLDRIDALQKELEDLRALKEKKTSESSTTSSLTGKQSEDEFIVVREADASSSGPATPPTNETMREKLEQLERRTAELTVENGSLLIKVAEYEAAQTLQESQNDQREELENLRKQLADVEQELTSQRQKFEELQSSYTDERSKAQKNIAELEFRLRTSEEEKEQLQLNLQSIRTELESKAQRLTMENQQLKLNAGAEQESLNNSAELEEKLKALAEENDTLRNELESSIAQAKFRQAIAEEKQKITDLDAEVEEEPFSMEKVRDLLGAFINDTFSEIPQEKLEQSYKALRERLIKIDSLEKSVAHMSDEISELQDNKMIWDHEKKTLEADISQYILQCEKLMKNNEILLTELENFKRNKLETINENHEETILQLETQLEECTNENRRLEHEYNSISEKYDIIDREQATLSEKLRESQASNENHLKTEQELQLRLEAMEQEKSDLYFELSETKASNEQNEIVTDLHTKCESLNAELSRMSKDHADLVNAMQTQQSALLESNKKRDVLEQELTQLIEKLKQAEEGRAHESDKTSQLQALQLELTQLKQDLNAKDIVTSTFKEAAQTAEKQLSKLQQLLEETKTALAHKTEEIEKLQNELATLTANQEQTLAEYVQLKEKCEELQSLKVETEPATELTPVDHEAVTRIAQLEAELLATADLKKNIETLNYERGEMIKALQQKHMENMQYYQEIQRLQPLVAAAAATTAENAEPKPCEECSTLKTLNDELRKEHEKLQDQINFLKEKSDILTTNLLTEQTNQKLVQHEKNEVVEQNNNLRKDLERLCQHLMEIEEQHTRDTMELQNELDDTKAKMVKLQEEVSKSSNAYTSASIRANQHAETLRAQYALVVQQRDELAAKLSWCEDRESKNQAALTNLQCALEQFQNDKENEIKMATQRIRKELQVEHDKETALQAELAALQQQLAEANQGLRAASRLSDQLEAAQQAINVLRDETESLKELNTKLEKQLNTSESNQTDKIEKNLIKSLLIGYVVSGNPNDKQQVLRMISSVLDFNAQESDKVGLNKQQTSWLGALLGGTSANTHTPHDTIQSRDNLVQAFVQFLEQESQPETQAQRMPNLLTMSTTVATTPGSDKEPIRRISATVIPASSVSEVMTPGTAPIQTMNINTDEFVPARNSSSILKDILSDT